MRQETVKTFEYRGGFSLIGKGEIEALIQAYKEGRVKKDEIRVFAARAEKKAIHKKSKVEIPRILNCKANESRIKRLRAGEIKRAGEKLASAIPEASGRLKAVSRRALRAIAQGRLTSVEALVFLYYQVRRITQVKALKRLLPDERYARFTYRELKALSGIPKANISRAVKTLKAKGLISTVWVVKQNENQFGLLFVDGPALSLIPGAAADRARPEKHKTTTPPVRKDTTPQHNLPTLIKINPKRDTKEVKTFVFKEEERGRAADFDRIKERARQMKEFFQEQAA